MPEANKPQPESSVNRDPQDRHKEREYRDKGMDRTLEDSYPASDPPSTIPDPAELVDPDQEDTAA
jgi:hypothetical protein